MIARTSMLLNGIKCTTMRFLILLGVFSFFAATFACGENHQSQQNSQAAITKLPNSVSTDQGQITYAPDGKSYRKELASEKKFLHLEGSPYEMGFSHGYLFPEAVKRMCSLEYFLAVAKGMLPQQLLDNKEFVDLMHGIFKTWVHTYQDNVPIKFREEMQGITDGVNAALGENVLEYDDVLLLNVGVSAFYDIGYPLIILSYYLSPILLQKYSKELRAMQNAIEVPHGCVGFVATNNATIDGRTVLGRHFQYPSEVFHEVACIIECVPDDGYPFVNVAAPGFVAIVSGMNSEGLGVGVNVTISMDVRFPDPGASPGILLRQVMQYTGSLAEAIKVFKNAKRGAAWSYIIGDAKSKTGAVIETSSHKMDVRYIDYHQPAGLFFGLLPDQVEDKDDLVTLTNHYIKPKMVFGTINIRPEDSTWRYDTITNLLLDNYGTIDNQNGRDLIDFLHPPAYDYYGDDISQPVSASVTFMDLDNQELWALHGSYSDPWVHYKME